ncbi:unnamed protein product [Paramecium octaurelia]|uniref:Transmembrane protein n=1 Tax=Paramecium octaurelia TaxID=43137 RepID=A0A8S1SYT1_PAROT|nr:unnamed protein product [Paramecium octaurelia]
MKSYLFKNKFSNFSNQLNSSFQQNFFFIFRQISNQQALVQFNYQFFKSQLILFKNILKILLVIIPLYLIFPIKISLPLNLTYFKLILQEIVYQKCTNSATNVLNMNQISSPISLNLYFLYYQSSIIVNLRSDISEQVSSSDCLFIIYMGQDNMSDQDYLILDIYYVLHYNIQSVLNNILKRHFKFYQI